jgi:hypothetical protein
VIINGTINLVTHTSHGEALTEIDLQNIALHELGHSLGLGHCNTSADLMYSLYSIGGPAEAVSALDTYGVAKVFGWMKNSSSFYPVNGWLNENTVTLPASITYQGLPVSPPKHSPQTITDNPVVQVFILMHPIIGVPILAIIVLFVIIAVFTRRRRPRAATVDS